MKKINYDKVRRWTVWVDCKETIDCLPYPEMVVGEVEGKGYQIPNFDVRILPPGSGGQLTLTVSGKGVFQCGKETISLSPGSVFLYRDRDSRVKYCTDPSSNEKWRFVWVNFRGMAADQLISWINERYGYVFHPGLDSTLAKHLCNYEQYAGKHLSLSAFDGAILVMEMLEELCETCRTQDNEIASELSSKVFRGLNARNGESLSIQALAQRIGVSREHLSRTFRSVTGETMRNYREKHRLQAAATLLLKSNISCKEIAELCHYGSYSSFFRAFQRNFGKSPELYRQDGGISRE